MKRWSIEEDKIIKNNYKLKDKNKILKILPHRTWTSIQIRASKLCVERLNYYTKEEINFIQKNYLKMRSGEIAKHLGRSSKSIEKKANELGLIKQTKWTSEDEKFVLQNILKIVPEEIAKKLGRSVNSLYHKIQELSLQRKTNRYGELENSKILSLLHSVFIEIGRTPTREEFNSYGLPSENVFATRFGSYGKACVLAEIPINKGITSNAMLFDNLGNICLSNAEKRISDFLIENHVSFLKEVPYSKITNDKAFGKMRMDWLLQDGTIVEYFGMSRNKRYKKSMDKKIKLCKKNNLILIGITDKEIRNLKEIFFDYI